MVKIKQIFKLLPNAALLIRQQSLIDVSAALFEHLPNRVRFTIFTVTITATTVTLQLQLQPQAQPTATNATTAAMLHCTEYIQNNVL